MLKSSPSSSWPAPGVGGRSSNLSESVVGHFRQHLTAAHRAGVALREPHRQALVREGVTAGNDNYAVQHDLPSDGAVDIVIPSGGVTGGGRRYLQGCVTGRGRGCLVVCRGLGISRFASTGHSGRRGCPQVPSRHPGRCVFFRNCWRFVLIGRVTRIVQHKGAGRVRRRGRRGLSVWKKAGWCPWAWQRCQPLRPRSTGYTDRRTSPGRRVRGKDWIVRQRRRDRHTVRVHVGVSISPVIGGCCGRACTLRVCVLLVLRRAFQFGVPNRGNDAVRSGRHRRDGSEDVDTRVPAITRVRASARVGR